MSAFIDPFAAPPATGDAAPPCASAHHLSTRVEAASAAFRRAEQRYQLIDQRRVVDHVAHRLPMETIRMGRAQGYAASDAIVIEDGFQQLFDGESSRNWEMVGSGHFVIVDGRLESVPANDLGLFWCTVPTPPDFVLRLRWLRWRHEDASGVFVRFPRPTAASVAIERGFEVRIDEVGIPGAATIHRTGAIFNEPSQRITPHPALPAAEWNDFEIAVRGQRYDVQLNGWPVTSFDNADRHRGWSSAPGAPSFIGLQVYPGSRVAFRNIRIKAL
jgi:hypothetical protein